MENKLFYTIEDVMKIYNIKKSSAYKMVSDLNKELEAAGVLTQSGVIRADYFRERAYIWFILSVSRWSFLSL